MTNNNEQELLNNHIHPMEIRLKGVEKDVEHLAGSVNQLSDKIDKIDGKMDGIDGKMDNIGMRLGRIMWWGAGVGSTIGIVIGIWNYLIPFIQAVPPQ